MASFPYVQTKNRLPKLFSELRSRGKPEKVTHNWLKGAGFTSSNDRAFVSLLRFLGILDRSGTPTDLYDRLRQQKWEAELGSIVRSAYADVFTALPDATERTRQELVNQFRALDLNASDRTAGLMVATFQGLVELAEFQETEHGSTERVPAQPEVAEVPPQPESPRKRRDVAMTINLSLELPATDKPEVYDMLFKSMAEHLGELLAAGDE